MLKILYRTLLLSLLLLPSAVPCRATEFLLFYSNDVRGETEPCGCSARQLGGMSRKAAQIKLTAAKEQLPSLFLDSGGLLFKHVRLSSGQEEQAEIAAESIIEAMQVMNCRAVGIGAHDLAGGIDLLRQFQDIGQLTWLSMNLVDAKQQHPVFTPFLSIETAGITVAVLGLTNEKIPLSAADKKSYVLLPWVKTLPKVLAKVKDKADMIILLSSCSSEENKKIAAAYPEINLLLASGSTAATVYPFIVKETLFAQTGARGKNLGVMHVVWTEARKWDQQDFSAIRTEQGRLDRIILQMRRLEQQAGTRYLKRGKNWHQLQADKKAAEANIQAMLRQQKATEKNLSRFTARFIPLESSLPKEAAVRKIMNKMTQRINAFSKAEKENNAPPADLKDTLRSLAGWRRCEHCHAVQTAFWQQSGHAQSMTALEKKQQQFNPECVVCHVTLPAPEAAAKIRANKLLLRLPEQLRCVGCESCHGPSAAHAAALGQTAVPNAKPEKQVCTVCHLPEHDNHFVFTEKAKRIRCPDSAVELEAEKR